jgi:hypothetical protein
MPASGVLASESDLPETVGVTGGRQSGPGPVGLRGGAGVLRQQVLTSFVSGLFGDLRGSRPRA